MSKSTKKRLEERIARRKAEEKWIEDRWHSVGNRIVASEMGHLYLERLTQRLELEMFLMELIGEEPEQCAKCGSYKNPDLNFCQCRIDAPDNIKKMLGIKERA